MAQILLGSLNKRPGKPSTAAPAKKKTPSPAKVARATPARAPKAPITGVDSVTIEKVTGGFVVQGMKDGDGDWKNERALATTPAARDRLVREMLAVSGAADES